MLNTPWDTGSPLYRRLLLTSLALTGIGILIAVAGSATGSDALVFTGVPVILTGLLTRIAGLVVRGRDVRRRHREQAGRK